MSLVDFCLIIQVELFKIGEVLLLFYCYKKFYYCCSKTAGFAFHYIA